MRMRGRHNLFKGVFPYLVTPLDKNEDINRPGMEKLCHYLLDAGVHGLTPLGSTGENSYLSVAQSLEVVETVVDACAGKIPVVPGLTSNSTRAAIEQARAYEAMGADGIVLTLDAYFPLPESSIREYFMRVADATGLPLIIYTNPNFQKIRLGLDLVVELSRDPRFMGIKDASSNTGNLLSMARRCREGFGIYAASAHIATSVMMLGGAGLFAGPACVLPHEYLLLYKLCQAGQWPQAMAVQRILWQFNEVFAAHGLAACTKVALEGLGFDVGPVIAPQQALPTETRREICAVTASVKEEIARLKVSPEERWA